MNNIIKPNMKQIENYAREKHDDIDFRFHILPVVDNSLLLAETIANSRDTQIDLEIVEIAAYLHDIGRGNNEGMEKLSREYYKKNGHHIIGSKMAIEFLNNLNQNDELYSEEMINHIAHCILAHRGRADPKPATIEAEIVNNADAMSHFDAFPFLFNVFKETTETIEDAIIQIEKKIDRDWNIKLTLPEAKEIIEEKYNAVKLMIKSMKKYM